MLGALIGLIIACIILGVVWWAIQRLLPLMPIAEPFATILHVLLVLLFVCIVLWFLLQILGMAGIHVPMWR